MFPGQWYRLRASIAADGIVSITLFMRRENCCVKCRTKSGISPWRSRKGGTRRGKTFKRKKRSDRNFCSLTIASRSRLVAAIKRASVRSVRELPSRSNSLSCSTRRSLVCNSRGISPISSKKIVPPLATSKRPMRCAIAPVNAPFSCPNSSLSSKPVGIGKSNANAITAHNPARAGHYGSEEFPELEIGNHMIGQFKEKSETLVLSHQLLLRGLRRIKMQRIVECESDLLSHYRKKLNFLGGIDTRSLTG